MKFAQTLFSPSVSLRSTAPSSEGAKGGLYRPKRGVGLRRSQCQGCTDPYSRCFLFVQTSFLSVGGGVLDAPLIQHKPNSLLYAGKTCEVCTDPILSLSLACARQLPRQREPRVVCTDKTAFCLRGKTKFCFLLLFHLIICSLVNLSKPRNYRVISGIQEPPVPQGTGGSKVNRDYFRFLKNALI